MLLYAKLCYLGPRDVKANSVPPKTARVLQLKERHPFPREDMVVFYEHDHSYFVDGLRVPRSVTSLLHEYATPFNPSRALASMKRGRDLEVK